jgi:hypothetical protein
MRISRFLQGSFVMLTLIVAPAAMIGITASAAGAQGARAVPDTSPAGYSIQSERFTANAGEQSTDAVDCPNGNLNLVRRSLPRSSAVRSRRATSRRARV